jgi:hypothetical protein
MLFLELWGLYFMSFLSFFFSLASKWVNCYIGYDGIAKPSTCRNKASCSGCLVYHAPNINNSQCLSYEPFLSN